MKEILSVINFTKSGKILMIVTGKDNSGKDEILSNKCCDSIDLMISDVIKPAIEEVYKKTEIHIKDVIIALSDLNTKVMQNRGYILLDSETDEISESDLTRLLNDMSKIHIDPGTKIINIVPLFYSVDDVTNIVSPICMCGKRLEGKFQIFVGEEKFIDDITNKLISQGIKIKKIIPANLTNARPFLTFEEDEILSTLVLNK